MDCEFRLVTKLDVADPAGANLLFYYANMIANGNWEYFNKMRHNVQRDWWTFLVTVKVAYNTFSLKAMEIATGVRRKNAPWYVGHKSKFAAYLVSPSFAT
jgi:hypothetical protein